MRPWILLKHIPCHFGPRRPILRQNAHHNDLAHLFIRSYIWELSSSLRSKISLQRVGPCHQNRSPWPCPSGHQTSSFVHRAGPTWVWIRQQARGRKREDLRCGQRPARSCQVLEYIIRHMSPRCSRSTLLNFDDWRYIMNGWVGNRRPSIGFKCISRNNGDTGDKRRA